MGNTTPISPTPALSIVAGDTYQVSFTVSGSPTAGETLTPSLGGISGQPISGNDSAEVQIITALTTGNLAFTPSSNWNGTVDGVSVKLLTHSNAVLSVENSSGTPSLEVRAPSGGNNDSFVGLTAGQSNTTGGQNTALGSSALESNTSAGGNTAVGSNALQFTTTGSNNTAQGYEALQGNTIGADNTALGYQAGYTSVAVNANTTGSNNTFIGYQAGPGSPTQLQNATAIGADATVNENNALALGCVSGVNGCTTTTDVGIGNSTPGNLLSVGALTTADSSAQLAVGTGAAGNKGIVIQAVNGQTADLFQVQAYNGSTILDSIDSSGDLSVQSATVNGSLTITGHLITGGGTPTKSVNANAGGGTCTVTGTDTAGLVTVVTGTGSVAKGTLCTITFHSAFSGTAPQVIVGAQGSTTATLGPYSANISTSGFDVGVATAPTTSTTYTFEYIVAQ
jgi:hypothetical protein